MLLCDRRLETPVYSRTKEFTATQDHSVEVLELPCILELGHKGKCQVTSMVVED